MSKNNNNNENKSREFANFCEANAAHFEVLRDINVKSGEIYLECCACLTKLLSRAKAKNLLKEFKPLLLEKHRVKHSSAVKMKGVDAVWGQKTEPEKAIFCLLFSLDNKSKLEIVSRLVLNRAQSNKNVGRFVAIDVSDDTVTVELKDPQDFVDLAKISESELKALVFGKPNAAPKLTVKKLEQAYNAKCEQVRILRNAVQELSAAKYDDLMAMRDDWDSVVLVQSGSDGSRSERATGGSAKAHRSDDQGAPVGNPAHDEENLLRPILPEGTNAPPEENVTDSVDPWENVLFPASAEDTNTDADSYEERMNEALPSTATDLVNPDDFELDGIDFNLSDAEPDDDDYFAIDDIVVNDEAPVNAADRVVPLEKPVMRARTLAAAHNGARHGAAGTLGSVQ